MDPMNNPTPTPNPTPSPEPGDTPSPDPMNGAMPEPGTMPGAEPMGAPGMGDITGDPGTGGITSDPGAPVVPPEPVAAVEPNPTPVNPVVMPGGAPHFQPTGMAATDPIMQPEPAKAPDPIEEELKAPMKAAAPVPGSIGSAVSGPNGDGPAPSAAMGVPEAAGQTPSVPFNDPAMQPDGAKPAKAKKAPNKKTLIALIIVAAMVVIALAAVLIVQIASGDSRSSNSSSSSSSSAVTPVTPTTPTDNGGSEGDQAPDVPTAEIAIVCDTSYTENGNMMESSITFQVPNNKLTDVKVDVTVTDAEGNSVSDSQTSTFEETVGVNAPEDDDAFLATDGTLLVSVNELSTQLESALNISGSVEYTCQVK